jgi:hypothetical protein
MFFLNIFSRFVNNSTKGNIDDTHSDGIYDARPPGLVFRQIFRDNFGPASEAIPLSLDYCCWCCELKDKELKMSLLIPYRFFSSFYPLAEFLRFSIVLNSPGEVGDLGNGMEFWKTEEKFEIQSWSTFLNCFESLSRLFELLSRGCLFRDFDVLLLQIHDLVWFLQWILILFSWIIFNKLQDEDLRFRALKVEVATGQRSCRSVKL